MAAKGSDSRQGLIVALVFAILLVIGLGVATYYGYAGQEDLVKQRKTALDAEAAAKKGNEWHRFLAYQYKAYLGTATKTELSELAVLRGRYESPQVSLGKAESNYADNKTVLEKLDRDNNLGWHKGENRPLKTAMDELARYETEAREMRKKLDAAMNDVNEAQKAQRRAEEVAANAAADYKKNLQKLNEELLTLQRQKQEAFEQLQAAFRKENERVEATEKKMASAIEEREKKLANLGLEKQDLEQRTERLTREKAELEGEFKRVRGQIDPVNLQESGPARGKIVRLDRSGTVAYLNLGSADNLRPQVRFSVFKDKGDGKATGELKASIQVTEVIGNHLAKAQVTYVRDPNRDPILPGDLLYNPTWSPTSREHVAVAGIIDLTGLGDDNTAEFIRTLERDGVVVDAYLDLKELAIKGKGMTTQTSYLILGEQPKPGVQGTLQDAARLENIGNVNEKITQMTETAAKLGIQLIPLRRYLVLTGQRVPRGITEAAAPGSLPRPKPAPRKDAAGEPAPKEGAKPAPKDEGK